LFLGHFKPLSPPDPFHSADADTPSLPDKQGPDPAVAITAIFRCQSNDRSCQGIFIRTTIRSFAVCRSMLAENPAGTALRDSKLLAYMIDTGTATSGA